MSDDPTGLTLDQLAAEEEELRFDRFDHDDAWRLGSMLVETARDPRITDRDRHHPWWATALSRRAARLDA